MKYLVLPIFFYLICCQAPPLTENSEELPVFMSSEVEMGREIPPTAVDTFLEANDPQWLNLAQNQLFMDTTRESIYYQYFQDWTPRIYHLRAIEAFKHKLQSGYAPPMPTLPRFPKAFLQLRKAHGQWVLYDRCTGMDARYYLQDGLFMAYDTAGVSLKPIERVARHTRDQLALILWEDTFGDNSHASSLQIEKRPEPYVYKMTYQNQGKVQTEWLTPVQHLDKFNLVVNHCPEIIVPEYGGF